MTDVVSGLLICDRGHDGPLPPPPPPPPPVLSGLTVITTVLVEVPQSVSAVAVMLNVPAAVVVPEITPVEVAKLRPAGKLDVAERVKCVVVALTPVEVAVSV